MKSPCRALVVAAACACAALAARGDETPARPSAGREVAHGDRLEVSNYAGSVSVTAWDRDEIRVEASVPLERIGVERTGSRIRVIPASWVKDEPAFEVRPPDMVRVRVVGTPPPVIDLQVMAPAWLPIRVEGPFIDVKLTGIEASIEVTVAGGRVEARSTAGPVAVVNLNGEILAEDGNGSLNLGGGAGSITVRRWTGDLRIETSTGDIRLEEPRAQRAEVTTVGGALTWLGPLATDGVYDLSTHGGDIGMRLPARPDAVFTLRSLRGRIETNLPRPPDAPAGRMEVTAGDGRATVRLVSFSGTIRVDAD